MLVTYQEKIYILRQEITTDIKNVVIKDGFTNPNGDYCLDCWGYLPAGFDKKVYFAEYSDVWGLKFDIGDGKYIMPSSLTINELADLADQIKLMYNENNKFTKEKYAT